MKRLAAACPGCGWCCSKTLKIHVVAADVERLSRELKKKKEEIFTFDGHEWFIKNAQPCQWWNPKNGRCTIYNIRPRTCRDWPLAENRDRVHTLVAVADCHYSVGVMVYKVLGALAVAREQQAETKS
jgi:Fe-S-cluster containining protein